MSNDGTILIAGTINETIELYLVDERGTLNLQEVLDVDKIYDAIDVSQNGNLVALAVN